MLGTEGEAFITREHVLCLRCILHATCFNNCYSFNEYVHTSNYFPRMHVFLISNIFRHAACRFGGTSSGFISHSLSRSGAAKELCETAIRGEGNLEGNNECMATTTWRDKVESAGTVAIVIRKMYFARACTRQYLIFNDAWSILARRLSQW